MNRINKMYFIVAVTMLACALINFMPSLSKHNDESIVVVEDTLEEKVHVFLEHNAIIEQPSFIDTSEIESRYEKEKETEISHTAVIYRENSAEIDSAGPAPIPVIHFSQEDYDNLLRIVEAEATGGDIKSKILVANVIINRVRNNYFPNTITRVIFQGNGTQFSPIKDGRFYKVKVQQSTIEAVRRALYGEDYSKGAIFFCSVSVARRNSWHSRNLIEVLEYGGHVYYVK